MGEGRLNSSFHRKALKHREKTLFGDTSESWQWWELYCWGSCLQSNSFPVCTRHTSDSTPL